jgi:hypothetical protein
MLSFHCKEITEEMNLNFKLLSLYMGAAIAAETVYPSGTSEFMTGL